MAPPPELDDLLAIARGYQRSRAVAAGLGIADLLRDGPLPVDGLARPAPCRPRTVSTIMDGRATAGRRATDRWRCARSGFGAAAGG